MPVAAEVLKHKIGFALNYRHEQDLLDAARDRFPSIAGLHVLGELDTLHGEMRDLELRPGRPAARAAGGNGG